jgi:hypothetical protein
VANPALLLLMAGSAMLAHFGLCWLLRRGLADDTAAARDLMAIPNRPLGTPDYVRLLRVRYYFPWSSLPPSASDLDGRVRLILMAARVTGFIFAICIFGVLVACIAEAFRSPYGVLSN